MCPCGDTPEKDTYDIVVIGGGPAGLSAAIYSARQGWSTAVVAGALGGQAAWAGKIENYLGWQLVTGAELVERFREHVSRFDVDCYEGQLVNAIVPTDAGFDVFTREGTTLHATVIILAAGRAPNRLSVPGEKELVGHGVSYCATCDAAFFKGKRVVVIGPGESACDAALQLAKLDAAVTLVSEREPRAHEAVLAKVAAEPRITLRTGAKVVRIEGTDRVEGVVIADVATGADKTAGADKTTGADKTRAGETIPAEGVFVELGSISVAEFTGGLVETNDNGEVLVNRRCATSRPGIYAAGDVTDGLGKQVIIAAGEGARAAVAADQDLKRG